MTAILLSLATSDVNHTLFCAGSVSRSLANWNGKGMSLTLEQANRIVAAALRRSTCPVIRKSPDS